MLNFAQGKIVERLALKEGWKGESERKRETERERERGGGGGKRWIDK